MENSRFFLQHQGRASATVRGRQKSNPGRRGDYSPTANPVGYRGKSSPQKEEGLEKRKTKLREEEREKINKEWVKVIRVGQSLNV